MHHHLNEIQARRQAVPTDCPQGPHTPVATKITLRNETIGQS